MERKFKIGDKVRIVKIKDEVNGRANKYLNQTAMVIDYWEDCYRLDIDRQSFNWYEEELESVNNSLFDKLAHSIAEAAKEANILVEPTEDGGIKISPLEKKEDDLPIDTPVMVGNKTNEMWCLRYYAYKGKVFLGGLKSKDQSKVTSFDYIIPFRNFNPNNIEESLKYNIVK